MSRAREQLVKDLGWWHGGACLDRKDLDWFPGPGESTDEHRKVCMSCRFRQECLDDALSMPASQDFGFLGGLSQRERTRLRRSKKSR